MKSLICREIRIVTGGFIVVLYRPLGEEEVVCTTWDAVLALLTGQPVVQKWLEDQY